jgi:phosphatidylinositol alpha-1,6-mannosyltransferase
MRLLITMDFPPREGGLQTWAFELARHLHRLGGPVTVLARKPTAANRAFDRRLSFPVWRMGGHDWDHYGHLYVAYYLLKFLALRGHKPLVYATHWKTGLVPAVLGSLIGMKVLIGAHGLEILKEKGILQRWLIRQAFRHAHRGIAVSSFARQALIRLGVPEAKLVRIPNGVDTKTFCPGKRPSDLIGRYHLEDRKVILTLARLVPRKGQDQVIRALPAVLQKVPDAVYLVAGKGGDEARLRALADSLGLGGRVIFCGYVPADEVVDHYRLADVYVMASREIEETGDVEGFGISFLEAGACRVPVIGGRSGGVSDAVIDGVTGLVVDPEDPDRIAGAIVRLLTDEEYAGRLASAARRRIVENLQWEHMAHRCLRLEGGHRG